MRHVIAKILFVMLGLGILPAGAFAEDTYDASTLVGRWAADGVIFAYNVETEIALTEWLFPLEYFFAADGTGYQAEGGKDYPFTWSMMFRREDQSPIGGLMTITKEDSYKISYVGFADANHFSETTIIRDGGTETPFHYQYRRME